MVENMVYVTCAKCNSKLEIRENDRIEGCREREEVFCPVCNELVTEVFTSGFPTVKVLEQKD